MKMQASDLKTAIKECDSSALQAMVDNFFAGLEARTQNPIVIGLLKGANKIVDFAMTAYGLTILFCLFCLPALMAQGLPRARDVVTEATLPRARDYVEVTVATAADKCRDCNGTGKIEEADLQHPGKTVTLPCDKCNGTGKLAKLEVPCKNCDCGCAEGAACSCDKSKEAPATTAVSASAGEEQEAGVSNVPAAQPQRFFRYYPARQRGRACST